MRIIMTPSFVKWCSNYKNATNFAQASNEANKVVLEAEDCLLGENFDFAIVSMTDLGAKSPIVRFFYESEDVSRPSAGGFVLFTRPGNVLAYNEEWNEQVPWPSYTETFSFFTVNVRLKAGDGLPVGSSAPVPLLAEADCTHENTICGQCAEQWAQDHIF